MNNEIKQLFDWSKNGTKEERYESIQELNTIMEQPVEWSYDVWDDLLLQLDDKDSHQRTRAAQYLSRLAGYSDPDHRILNDFDALWQETYDEKFVAARHTIQAIWRVGLGSLEARVLLMNQIEHRFLNGEDEKNFTLIRNDFLQGLRNLYDITHDETIRDLSESLIATVDNDNYKKKYLKIWK